MSDNYILNVTIEDGKYTVRCENDGKLHALRYGEPWRDLTGDKMVYCLAAEVERLRARLIPCPDCELLDNCHSVDCSTIKMHTAKEDRAARAWNPESVKDDFVLD